MTTPVVCNRFDTQHVSRDEDTLTVLVDFNQTTIQCGIAKDALTTFYNKLTREINDVNFYTSLFELIKDALGGSMIITRAEKEHITNEYLERGLGRAAIYNLHCRARNLRWSLKNLNQCKRYFVGCCRASNTDSNRSININLYVSFPDFLPASVAANPNDPRLPPIPASPATKHGSPSTIITFVQPVKNNPNCLPEPNMETEHGNVPTEADDGKFQPDDRHNAEVACHVCDGVDDRVPHSQSPPPADGYEIYVIPSISQPRTGHNDGPYIHLLFRVDVGSPNSRTGTRQHRPLLSSCKPSVHDSTSNNNAAGRDQTPNIRGRGSVFHTPLPQLSRVVVVGRTQQPPRRLAFGTANMSPNDYISYISETLNSKGFLKRSTFPVKTAAESWPHWYKHLTAHGQLHGVFIPPWASITSEHVYGQWWPDVPSVIRNRIRHMAMLIKIALSMNGVIPSNSNTEEQTLVQNSSDGYSALHAIITPYHPALAKY
jgi:hypothetical protein